MELLIYLAQRIVNSVSKCILHLVNYTQLWLINLISVWCILDDSQIRDAKTSNRRCIYTLRQNYCAAHRTENRLLLITNHYILGSRLIICIWFHKSVKVCCCFNKIPKVNDKTIKFPIEEPNYSVFAWRHINVK